MGLIDSTVHFELGRVIKCDFKPESIEGSTDLGYWNRNWDRV
jgi:hypothetical protein